MKRPASLLLLALAACNSADAAHWDGSIADSAGVAIVTNPAHGDWAVRAAPTLTQDLDIGTAEGEAEYQFGQIAGIDIAANGDILVLDQQAAQVRVFDSAGKYLRTIGRPGTGPGELSQAVMGVRAGAGDTVYVADVMRQRLVKFAGDGTEAGSVEMRIVDGIPVGFKPAPGGRVAYQLRRLRLPGAVDTTKPPRDFIIIRDLVASTADTVAELESGETVKFGANSMEMKIFASEPIWTVLEDGRVVRGRNDVYRLEVFSPDGKLERVINRPVERVAVTPDQQDAYRDMLRASTQRQPQVTPQALEMVMKSMSFAEFLPVYNQFFGGPDNTLWVQRFPTSIPRLPEGKTMNPEDLSAPEWDVFDAEGRLLGMVKLPERFNPVRVMGDAIYGLQLDDMDVQHVVRLRIRS